MMHPATEIQFISPEIGYGVVAKDFIPRGTITWVQDPLDQKLKPQEVARMHPRVQEMVEKYAFRNNSGELILCWDLAKYVNHSFKSNCLSTAYDFEIAVRDIEPGEQLTDDYGYLNIDEPFRAQPEGTERSIVYPDDLLKYHKVWDRALASAFENFHRVAQPLEGLISSEILNKIRDKIANDEPMDSILNLYYDRNT